MFYTYNMNLKYFKVRISIRLHKRSENFIFDLGRRARNVLGFAKCFSAILILI